MPKPTPVSNTPTAARVLTTSFLVNISDVILNFTIALLSGSVIITSQGLQGLADLISTGCTLIGIKRSRRPADRNHPFGYGKELYFWTLIAGLVTFSVSATLSFYLGLEHFFAPKQIDHTGFAFGVLILGLFTNGYSLSQSLKRLNHGHPPQLFVRTYFHSTLVETKAAFILDLTGTTTSVFGLLALSFYTATGNSRFDGLGAMILGFMLGVLALTLLFSLKDLITGKSASLEVEQKIRSAIRSVNGVTEILDLRTQHVGTEKLLVNVEVHLSHGLTTVQIEHLIDRIKEAAHDKVPAISHIQVELETPEKS